MNHKRVYGRIAFAGLAFAALLPNHADPQRQAATTQPQVFTVRYVVFVATPKTALTRDEVKASNLNLPPVFDQLQNGSAAAVMDTTPEVFANKLRAAQPDYTFQTLLSGSVPCINGSEEPAVINAGPNPNDSMQTTLAESIFLTRNAPGRLTLHHTGRLVYSDKTGRGGPGWDDMHTDKIIIGRTYSQGIDNLNSGGHMVYAFCILPGNLNQTQTASAWNRSKARKTTAVAAKMRRAVR